jgi:hypothetical protein
MTVWKKCRRQHCLSSICHGQIKIVQKIFDPEGRAGGIRRIGLAMAPKAGESSRDEQGNCHETGQTNVQFGHPGPDPSPKEIEHVPVVVHDR